MCVFQQKFIKNNKRQKTLFGEIEIFQAGGADPAMAERLELSDHEFKTTMNNMLRALMDLRHSHGAHIQQ